MRANNYQERALSLVSVDPKTGKYVLSTEAEQFLRSVPAPIGVVSVAGLYRTGKSYLLNKMLLNRNNGFGVGPTINPCTKGLWCWGTPLRGQSQDGQKLNIIVIDTQGIGALDQDQTHDTRIFTLAILASSCFIYNSVGSIDQTAVQNLSLVVNLTKHIQLRTDTLTQNQDPDKIANYFPSFFWVVRDFSLQMVDPDGNKMTSKDYLEKALAPQKGFSEDIQEKNRIRKILTSFFKERECFTFVRPLTDETKLQDLANIDSDDLRGQFVSQILNLRKRVTHQMKPKTLNGQKLSGQLYVSMLNSYVGAINNGAVPNIENAWSYMCQQQCQKVLTQSYDTFEKQIKQIRIPCSVDDFTKGVQVAEQLAYQVFKKKSIGEDTDRYYKELQTKMRQKIQELRKINTQQGKNAFKKYIAPEVSLIQQKIGKQQYGTFEQFSSQLTKLQQKTLKNCPKYVDLNLNCQLCINRILNQGIGHMFKKMRLQKQQVRKTLQQRIKLMQGQVDTLKKQRDSEEVKMRQKITQLDREKLDIGFKLQRTQLDLQRKTTDLGVQSEQLSKTLNEKKKQIESLKRQFQLKITQANKKIQQMNSNQHDQRSQWQKEKAIYELKVKQQTQTISDLEKKKSVFDSKLALETSQLNQKHRQQTIHLQQQIQELTKTLNSFKQKNQDLSTQFADLSGKHTALTDKFETTQRKLKQDIMNKTRDAQKIKMDSESQLNKLRRELTQYRDDQDKYGKDSEQRLRKQQFKFKQVTQQLKNTKARYDRQNQILNQQLEFTKISYEQIKQKFTQSKTWYEQKIKAIQEDAAKNRETSINEKINNLNAAHQQQKKKLQDQFKQTQKSWNTQIQNLSKIKNQLQLTLRINIEQLSNQRNENEESKRNLTSLLEKLQNDIKNIEREKNTQLFSKQGFYNQKISQLETQLQELKQKFSQDKEQLDKNFQNQITTIKNTYMIQSQAEASTHAEEREKQKKRYSKMVEQYEKRIQQQTNALQEQLETVRAESEAQIIQLRTVCKELGVEKDVISKQKRVLEDNFNELQQKHAKMEYQLNERFQKLLESSRNQKQNLITKLQDIQNTKNSLEKQLLSMSHERDTYKSQSIKSTAEIEQLKGERNLLQQRFQNTRRSLEDRLKESQNTYMRERSRFDTDIALMQQKKQYSEKKISQLQADLKTTKERQQQQLRLLRQKKDEEISNITNKASTQKRSYEEKIEKLKKQSVQTENSLQRQLSEISKAKAIDEQRIQYLEKNISQIEIRRNSEVQSLNQQLRTTKEKLSNERAQTKSKIQQLQQSVHKKQNELSDLKNQFDIKFALGESKIKNLQQTNETIITQKNEMVRNLQKQLDQYRKKTDTEMSAQHGNYRDVLSKMESRFRTQISNLSQEVVKKTQQNQFLVKDHERTVKDLNQKLALQKQNKQSLQMKITRIQSQFAQKQGKLVAEVEKFKTQRDVINLQNQKIITKERETYKNRIADLQKKVIQVDRIKQATIYEKQKLEGKWRMQKSSYEQKLEQCKEQLEKERNQTKRLLKDNQRLKADKKRNSSYINIKNQTMMMPNEIMSQNKENAQFQ